MKQSAPGLKSVKIEVVNLLAHRFIFLSTQGDEVMSRIRSDPRLARIPIVITIAFDLNSGIVKRAIRAGARSVVQTDRFQKSARRCLDIHEPTTQVSNTARHTQPIVSP